MELVLASIYKPILNIFSGLKHRITYLKYIPLVDTNADSTLRLFRVTTLKSSSIDAIFYRTSISSLNEMAKFDCPAVHQKSSESPKTADSCALALCHLNYLLNPSFSLSNSSSASKLFVEPESLASSNYSSSPTKTTSPVAYNNLLL